MPTAFEAFQMFHAIKCHFLEDKYDAFRYDFKTSVDFDTFDARQDKHFYYRIVKKYTTDDMVKGYFLSNIIRNPESVWIGDCDDEHYDNWKKRTEGLTYNFKQDCQTLSQKFNEPVKLFQGNPPAIVNEYFGGRISLETLTIFNAFSGVTDSMEENILLGDTKSLVSSYRPFLKFDVREKAEQARLILDKSHKKT